MEKEVLVKLKEQVAGELKALAEEMGKLQYQVLMRNTFLQGIEAEIKKAEDAQGPAAQG